MAEAIASLSNDKKLALAIERSLAMLPVEAAEIVKSMLSPTNIAIMLGTLVLWATSHFVGIGEIVDVILLAAGVLILGFSVFDGAEELTSFTTTAIRATNENQINDAARHFAKAVDILGISIISAILLRRSARPVLKRGMPRFHPMPKLGKPPIKTIIRRPHSLPGGDLGETDAWGNIAVSRSQSISEQRLTLYHEWIHSVLSPKFKLFRRFRAQFRLNAYNRSALMTYLEEAIAESYSQLRAYGLRKAITGFSFPLDRGYITVSELRGEGIAIGNIIVGSTLFHVYLHHQPWGKVFK